MRVALDNTFLSPIFDPAVNVRDAPDTGTPTEHIREKLEALVGRHSEQGDTILIPTPTLAEMLFAVPDFGKAIAIINESSAFEIAEFNGRCAVTYADIMRDGRYSKSILKKQNVKDTWAKIKFDRQIVIIAKVFDADLLYTDDENQKNFAHSIGLDVKSTWELDLPAKYAQTKLPLD